MSAHLPAAVLALLSLWAGTLGGQLSAAGAATVQGVALLALVLGAPAWRDPLRLGRWGRWLVPVALVGLGASWLASPVPRAGAVGLWLAPALLLAPVAVAACWRGRDRAERGAAGVALVLAAVSLWALLAWLAGWSERAAEPLGHHAVLGLWLVTLLPLVAERARRGDAGGWIARGALALGVLALAATGSLAAWAAVGAQAFCLAVGHRRLQRRLLVVAALLALLAAPRLVRVVTDQDPSLRARGTYHEAAQMGWSQRLLLGWGPGSTGWTLGRFLEPIPGVNPPSEIVGQLHSQPLTIFYELGAFGYLWALGLGLAFVAARLRERDGERSAPIEAGLLGLVGAVVVSLGHSVAHVGAVAAAVVVAAGAALAGGATAEQPVFRVGGRVGALALVYALAAVLWLVPRDRAQLEWQRAREAPTREQAAGHLRRAVELDPTFPLYRARFSRSGEKVAAAEALAAARGAPGVGQLWLNAGVAGVEAGAPWAEGALGEAMASDPHGAWAPFFLAFRPAAPERSAACLARALLLEPRLGASPSVAARPDLVAAAGAAIARWPGVEAGLRQALVEALEGPLPAAGPVVELGTGEEHEQGGASATVFHRLPWGEPWFRLPLVAASVPRFDLPSAASLPATSRTAFPRGRCAPPAATAVTSP
ncbi:MAG TPA: O-antigen ligase family protein [Thermoanaerobaculia bacterium]|nr:O-antigen ligase family protein [Thermoanaerobaculia bacterium]